MKKHTKDTLEKPQPSSKDIRTASSHKKVEDVFDSPEFKNQIESIRNAIINDEETFLRIAKDIIDVKQWSLETLGEIIQQIEIYSDELNVESPQHKDRLPQRKRLLYLSLDSDESGNLLLNKSVIDSTSISPHEHTETICDLFTKYGSATLTSPQIKDKEILVSINSSRHIFSKLTNIQKIIIIEKLEYLAWRSWFYLPVFISFISKLMTEDNSNKNSLENYKRKLKEFIPRQNHLLSEFIDKDWQLDILYAGKVFPSVIKAIEELKKENTIAALNHRDAEILAINFLVYEINNDHTFALLLKNNRRKNRYAWYEKYLGIEDALDIPLLSPLEVDEQQLVGKETTMLDQGKRVYRKAGSEALSDTTQNPKAEINRLTKMFGVRVSPDLIEQFSEEAKRLGKTKTQYLTEILEKEFKR